MLSKISYANNQIVEIFNRHGFAPEYMRIRWGRINRDWKLQDAMRDLKGIPEIEIYNFIEKNIDNNTPWYVEAAIKEGDEECIKNDLALNERVTKNVLVKAMKWYAENVLD